MTVRNRRPAWKDEIKKLSAFQCRAAAIINKIHGPEAALKYVREALSPAKTAANVSCEDCHDTGYVGDMGPGIIGNREWHECDCRRGMKTDDEKWRDHFIYPIALEMKRRGIGELHIKIQENGKAAFELIPTESKTEETRP